MGSIINSLGLQMQAITFGILVITAIVHIIFAGAVARDAGEIKRAHRKTYLVSGITWAFATLIGGVFVAVAYFVLHHIRWVKC